VVCWVPAVLGRKNPVGVQGEFDYMNRRLENGRRRTVTSSCVRERLALVRRAADENPNPRSRDLKENVCEKG